MGTILKVSSTEFSRTVAQPELVIVKSLDDLLREKESLLQGIQNNKNAIAFQKAKLDEIDAEIKQVKSLGIKSSAEIKVEAESELIKEVKEAENL